MKIEVNADDLVALLIEQKVIKDDFELICNDTMQLFGALLAQKLADKSKVVVVDFKPNVTVHQCNT